MTDQAFQGFGTPQENWSKLPHTLIAALPTIKSASELKVILYILRHTWGFHETEKRISLDEFANGRKKRGGERMDGGTGMSIPSIRSGIKRAIEHGFISVETDDSDKARVKKYYSLNQTVKSLHPDCKKVTPRVQESCTRTKKETVETNPKKDIDAPSAQPPPLFPGQFSLSVSKIKERKFKRSEWEIILEAEKTRPDKPPRATLVKWLESKLNGSSHPAIQAYREEMGSYPRKNQFQDIIDTVGEKGGAELFKQIVHVWKMSGWNPLNIGGMLECYERGEIPKNGKQKSTTGTLSGRPHRASLQGENGQNRAPELSSEPTPDELAAELAAAAEHHLLQQQSAANG